MTNVAVTNTFTSGTTISSSQVNTNFSDLVTFLNSTGVHVFQAGTVNATALASNAVTTAKIADDAVTAAKIADGTIVPGLFSNPQWIQVELTSGISLTEATDTVITAAAYGAQLNATGNYGTNVGWDSTNKRPYAVTAGTFLITVMAEVAVVHTAASVITRSLRLKKNTSTVVDVSNNEYVGGGTGDTTDLYINRIVTANANDYFRFSVAADQITGSYTSATITNGAQSATYMQVVYLGA